NENRISGDQISDSFSVFTDRFELGKYYFDAGNYADALSQFKQIQPQNDDTRYFVVLSYFHQSDIKKALDTFDTINVKTNYLGDSRNKEIPQMPRVMTNKIWGNLMDNLNAHRKDSAYLSYMASVAEELGRGYDAKMYRDYAKKQK
ncbi:MAG: tetratricopeptide repeat protein, partial [Chloroflexi bacterium]|nr:tetratricopeptide repeat protein [Chloroflexota bacterium]